MAVQHTRLARRASRRYGLFTSADAHAAGVSRRMLQRGLASGRYEIVHRGVYRTAGSERSWKQHKGPIPVTSPTRTIVDLARVLRTDELEDVLDEALWRKMTTLERLRGRLADLGVRGRPGIATLRRLLAARADRGPESHYERRAQRLLARAGLPDPVFQFPFRLAGRRGRIDLAYPQLLIAIEIDGSHHDGLAQTLSDEDRQRALEAAGWLVCRFRTADLYHRPDEFCREVAVPGWRIDRLMAASWM